MAKSLGSYRGYGCMYECERGEHHFVLKFYRYGYKFDQSFERNVTAFENNLPYVSRRIIDQVLSLKKDIAYADLPDPNIPTFLKALPK